MFTARPLDEKTYRRYQRECRSRRRSLKLRGLAALAYGVFFAVLGGALATELSLITLPLAGLGALVALIGIGALVRSRAWQPVSFEAWLLNRDVQSKIGPELRWSVDPDALVLAARREGSLATSA